MRLVSLFTAMMAVFGMSVATMNDTEAADLENTIYLELKDGRVVIELLPELAPNHVNRIKELTRAGFYDGIVFHRVIEGFMAQTGDPTGTGGGGSDKPDLKAEFSSERHLRGVVSMARSRNPNSANSQFFIVFDDASWLDNQYTVWGRVTSGMEFVDQIKKGHPRSGEVDDPDKIVSMKVAADVE
ncbi:MAG: peptidylprolyl isomerase [Rhodospirillaceae bacterium]|nr:peptidylprolyl isomerase [Rhodospirillaceae bacterium]